MSAFIKINKLFEKLAEDELKAVQVYFDDFVTDKFNNYHPNIQILFLSLVYKDNTHQLMTYKELFPHCKWLTIPKCAFNSLSSNFIFEINSYIQSIRSQT